MSDLIEARVLPHDLVAERAVLGAILMRPDVLFDVAPLITPPDFFRDAHRRIFRHLLAMCEAKIGIDGLTLRDALQRSNELEAVEGPAYIFSLTDGVPHSVNAAEYARIVREKSALRQLAFASNKALAEAYSGELPAADVLERAQSALFEIAGRQVTGGFIDMHELMPATLEEIERLVADKRHVTGVATGFTDLDHMTRGLQPGDLVVVAGRPSMGKTAFAVNVAQHAAIRGGHQAAVFSLEMSRKSLGLRLIASEARIDHHRLLSGHVVPDAWSSISSAIDRLSDAGLHIDDASGATIFDIRAKARRLKASRGLDLIVIDYLQLMSGAQRAENKNLEVAAITKGLKAIARDLDIPVVLLSQLSRDTEKRGNHRPILADLRDSGAIEQDADVVIFIHREEKYAPTAENRGTAEAILAKQRNGPTGTVGLVFHDHLVRFDNRTRDTERRPYAEAGV